MFSWLSHAYRISILGLIAYGLVFALDLAVMAKFTTPILYLVVLFILQYFRAQEFYMFFTTLAVILTVFNTGVAFVYSDSLNVGDTDIEHIVFLANRLLIATVILLWGYLVNRNRRATEMLQNLSTTDPLTGLLNRREYHRISTAELHRDSLFNHPFSLLIFDIDDFKYINDTFGHGVGDAALRSLASCARRSLRITDILARFGGEEFIISMPETSLDEAKIVAERLRHNIEREVVHSRNAHFRMTVSIGLAESAAVNEGLDDLIDRADRALYQAKRAGKNRVIIAEAETPSTTVAPKRSNLAESKPS